MPTIVKFETSNSYLKFEWSYNNPHTISHTLHRILEEMYKVKEVGDPDIKIADLTKLLRTAYLIETNIQKGVLNKIDKLIDEIKVTYKQESLLIIKQVTLQSLLYRSSLDADRPPLTIQIMKTELFSRAFLSGYQLTCSSWNTCPHSFQQACSYLKNIYKLIQICQKNNFYRFHSFSFNSYVIENENNIPAFLHTCMYHRRESMSTIANSDNGHESNEEEYYI